MYYLRLLISGLIDTARKMLENFAHVRKLHGFIPNSGNLWLIFFILYFIVIINLLLLLLTYCLIILIVFVHENIKRASRRSQPPLLGHMVYVYFEATADRAFLMDFLPEVEEELIWLKKHRQVSVISPLDNTTQLTLFRYKVFTLYA